MKTLFTSKMFYHEETRGALIKSPVELLVGTARQLGVPINALRQAERAMAAMGQEIMQPPNVKGWDGGEKWINTATLFNRYNFVAGLVHGGGRDRARRDRKRRGAIRSDAARGNSDSPGDDPGQRRMAMGMMMGSGSRLENRPQPAYDPTPLLSAQKLESPEDIVDFYAGHLLAVRLSADKRQALVDFLTGDDARTRRRAPSKAARVRAMIHLMMSTPEYQLN